VLRLSAYKIWRIQSKANIFKFGVEWMGVRKMCVFQLKTGHISETGNKRAKGLKRYYEVAYTLSDERIIIDLDDLEGRYVLLCLNSAR